MFCTKGSVAAVLGHVGMQVIILRPLKPRGFHADFLVSDSHIAAAYRSGGDGMNFLLEFLYIRVSKQRLHLPQRVSTPKLRRWTVQLGVSALLSRSTSGFLDDVQAAGWVLQQEGRGAYDVR